LKKNKYFVESRHSDVIQRLLKDSVIQECLINTGEEIASQSSSSGDVTQKMIKINMLDEQQNQIQFPT